MKEKFARAPVLVAALVVALLLLIGTYTVIAGQVRSLEADVADAGGAGQATSWGSGWMFLAPGTSRVFTHGLGIAPEQYVVEMWFLDTDEGLGINRRYYGSAEDSGNWYGAYWYDLTANTISVYRQPQDNVADRIRIWIGPAAAAPDYDSTWTGINPGQTITFSHGLNITATDLTVSLWFSGTTRGIHHLGYGGLAIDPLTRMEGAHWHDLTTNTVQVTRHPQDLPIDQVRVVVVHSGPPAYDSLVDVGDWQNVKPGLVYTFTHGLNWNPNMMLMRAECYSTTGGIHQWLAGGNHDWLNGGQWQGGNLQNLTNNTVQIYRQPNDVVCPQVRVRAWLRATKVYLPLVLNSPVAPTALTDDAPPAQTPR